MLLPNWKHALVGSAVALVALAVPAFAQGAEQRTELKRDLAEALEKLHAANQAEVQMGELAIETAVAPDVKEYAQRMVKDHGDNDAQLEKLAQNLNVDLMGKAFEKSNSEHMKTMTKGQKKMGADFDRWYIDTMVKDHKKDVKDVGKAADMARKEGHTDLYAFLDDTHKKLQEHLTLALQQQKMLQGQPRVGRRGPETAPDLAPQPAPERVPGQP
ncbi:MAG: DUF4142 domain-containing protein [Myxococcaceae bacterium]